MSTLARSGDGVGLVQRLDAASTRAAVLREQSGRLVREAREQVRVDPQAFTVHGVVDGRPTTVRWRHGRLLADPELLLRLHLVVDLDTADGPGPRPALDGSRTQLLLAVLRALDRVRSVRLTVPDQAGAGESSGRARTEDQAGR